MGAYDLQEYLNFLATQLSADNASAAALTDRATRIQDEYLYRKEASRNRRSLHSSPRKRAPRYDKRKHKFEAPKKYPEYKLEDAKKKNEEHKEKAELAAQDMAQEAISKAASFHVPPPPFVDLNNKVQRYCWVQSIKKVASEGQLLTTKGTPAYDFLSHEYLSTLNAFGPANVSSNSSSRLEKIARNGEHI